MGLRIIYTVIEAQLQTILDGNGNPAYAHYHTWNNDIQQTKDGKEIIIPYPACLMEVIIDDIQQLGNGDQRFDLTIHLHIVHKLFHAGSEYEQNWDVFDLVDLTYFVMQQWKNLATQLGQFIRVGQTQDFSHDQLYHFIQTYKSTYIDLLSDLPKTGTFVIKAPPTGLIVNRNP